jgi:hypothetical protein
VEFYRGNLHMIVTSIWNKRKMQTWNKSAMMNTRRTTTMTTTPSPPISLENEQQAWNDSSAEDIAKKTLKTWLACIFYTLGCNSIGAGGPQVKIMCYAYNC